MHHELYSLLDISDLSVCKHALALLCPICDDSTDEDGFNDVNLSHVLLSLLVCDTQMNVLLWLGWFNTMMLFDILLGALNSSDCDDVVEAVVVSTRQMNDERRLNAFTIDAYATQMELDANPLMVESLLKYAPSIGFRSLLMTWLNPFLTLIDEMKLGELCSANPAKYATPIVGRDPLSLAHFSNAISKSGVNYKTLLCKWQTRVSGFWERGC